MLLSEFNVQRRDFWFHWTYPAVAQVIYLRIERQPEPDKKQEPINSKYELDGLFIDP